jgi:8-oxo-dGTP diphosphatase
MTAQLGDSEIPAPNQQVITACAFIHQEFDGVQKVFLPQRAETKKFLPGVFELPGGHIEFGEDPVSGLIREIKEELSAGVVVGDLFSAFTYTNEIKGSHSIELVYFAQFTDWTTVSTNPRDHSGYRWVAESELSSVYSAQKGADDAEMRIIREGFRLLSGGNLNFGKAR